MKKKTEAESNTIGTRGYIKIDIEIGDINSLSNPRVIHSNMNNLTPQEENTLAKQLAEALEEPDALALHLTLVRKFPKEVLLETLARVMATDKSKIKKTRGAYFTYLMSLYERKHRNDFGA